MKPATRRKHLNSLGVLWDAEVGDRPENFDSLLGRLLSKVPLDALRKAILEAAADASLQDAEDVLERVHAQFRARIVPTKRPEDLTPQSLRRAQAQAAATLLLGAWDAHLAAHPPGLKDLIRALSTEISQGSLALGAVHRALLGACTRHGLPEQALGAFRKTIDRYRGLLRAAATTARRRTPPQEG